MQFKPVTFEDKSIIMPYIREFAPSDPRFIPTERSFTTLIWQKSLNLEFAFVEDCLILRITHPKYGTHYRFPLGPNPQKAIEQLDKDISFHGIYAPQAKKITEWLPNYTAIPVRDFFAYVYEVQDLINLSGKKFHGKKNHFNAFVRENPDYKYEKMTAELAKCCAEVYPSWFENHGQIEDEFFQYEGKLLLSILESWVKHGLDGGLVCSGGKIVSFTVSEKLTNDVALIHFEKAHPTVRGAYTAINKLHLEHTYADVKYVNREEDAGIEGLRRAKQSYHPCFMVEKFMVANKSALRSNILNQRKDSEPISFELTDHPRYKDAKTICCYQTLPGEVDTADFIKQALKDGKQVLTPEENPKNPDLTIVPALAFDSNGNRLGRGGGWYDKFLANNQTYSIGVIQRQFLLNNLPIEPHDIPVNEVIVPQCLSVSRANK